MPIEKIVAVAPGKPWSGEASINPFNPWGKPDPVFNWAGWMYAADTGVWRWRAKTNYPIQSGVTSTAGGIVFFGDMGGNIGPGDRAIWERTENWRKVRVPNNLASRHRSRSGWVKSLNLLMNKHGDLRPGAEPVQGFLGR